MRVLIDTNILGRISQPSHPLASVAILAAEHLRRTGFELRGRAAHDARLVAAMERHAISHIPTFNTGDFTRYPGITVLDPMTLASPAR